jgi:translation initiation factor IF-3
VYLKVDSSYLLFLNLKYLLEVFCIANKKTDLLINEQIKAGSVLVIGPNGEQVGVKPLKDALILANYAGLDLVLMNANGNPPVCKIMDYNKYRYERNKKEKENMKRQKANMSETKEFRLSPVIDVGDFNTKINQVTKYLKKGDKIKVTIRFKGRQMEHTELGLDVMNRFAERLADIAEVSEKPSLDGRTMTMLLTPKK